MKILEISRLYHPHVGGVEKQLKNLNKQLIKRNIDITIITEKYTDGLENEEVFEGTKIVRFSYPKIRLLGLLYIWLWFFRNTQYIREVDIVHTHGVFVWYLPFRFIFPFKPVYTTFHGWEGIYPIPTKNIFLRKVAATLSWKYLCIGKFIEKHYKIKADKTYYTAVDIPKKENYKKDPRTLLYVGRLDEDTGLPLILKSLSYLNGYEVVFCGDGFLADECKKFGKVRGFVDPSPYFEKAAICLSPGHTSILEAFTYKCLVITTYDNPVKRDYLKMTPFEKNIIVRKDPKKMAEMINYYSRYPKKAEPMIENAYRWVKTQSWENITELYIELWGVK